VGQQQLSWLNTSLLHKTRVSQGRGLPDRLDLNLELDVAITNSPDPSTTSARQILAVTSSFGSEVWTIIRHAMRAAGLMTDTPSLF
jgi:hypothetical protein